MIVGYLRVSTDRQELSPEGQRKAIEAWAQRQGQTVAAWFEDELCSVTEAEDRPGLSAALKYLQEHGPARSGKRVMGDRVLAVAKRDRLGRDMLLVGLLERQLAKEHGITVASADGLTNDNTPVGRLMRRQVDSYAEYERDMIRERVKAALAVKRSRGERVSRYAPVGYRFAGDTLEKDEAEQRALDLIYKRRAAGDTPGAIVKWLVRHGLTFRGGPWHRNTVARILSRR